MAHCCRSPPLRPNELHVGVVSAPRSEVVTLTHWASETTCEMPRYTNWPESCLQRSTSRRHRWSDRSSAHNYNHTHALICPSFTPTQSSEKLFDRLCWWVDTFGTSTTCSGQTTSWFGLKHLLLSPQPQLETVLPSCDIISFCCHKTWLVNVHVSSQHALLLP